MDIDITNNSVNSPKELHTARKLGIIFTVIGISLLALLAFLIALYKMNDSQLDAQTTSTSATIHEKIDAENDTLYKPTYEFKVNDKTYICESFISSSIRPDEGNVTIYYESANPNNCASDYTRTGARFFYFFLIIPVVFIIVGIVFIVTSTKRLKNSSSSNGATASQQPPTIPSSSGADLSQGYNLS
ncbi:MAG: hypothetical protein K5837_02610 [Candidatus Saccharibacteria bacterium]|nr:hypothetical protein [Candidatus Saccharibacteria bacterium]